jgi:hypothetical protein
MGDSIICWLNLKRKDADLLEDLSRKFLASIFRENPLHTFTALLFCLTARNKSAFIFRRARLAVQGFSQDPNGNILKCTFA